MGQELKAAALRQGQITLKTAAGEINTLHGEAMRHCRAGLEKARQAGKLLCEAKAAIRHGAFEAWVTSEEGCDFSVETARRYMRLHTNWDELIEQYGSRISSMTINEGLKKIAKASSEPPKEPKRSSMTDLNHSGEDSEDAQCFKGGEHVWEEDPHEDGEFCAKCHIERPAVRPPADKGAAGHLPAEEQAPAGEAPKDVARGELAELFRDADRVFGQLVNLFDDLWHASGDARAAEEIKTSLNVAYDDFVKWRKRFK